MQKLKFVWIDDSLEREEFATNLAHAVQAEVQFLSINKAQIFPELKTLLGGNEPDLIIMDHHFNEADSDAIRTGSTAAAIIREQWTDCPIVSFTGVDILDVDARHKSAYEAMYPINKISHYYTSIYALAEGVGAMKASYPNDLSSLLSFLNAPEDELEKIKKILPKELKENFTDKSLIIEMYRWCQSVFFDRPGFLYNKTWASMLLGITEEGFDLIKDDFSASKYSGVFNDNSNERWWKSKLLEILGEKTGKIGLPWALGRELISHDEKLFSKCFSSGEYFPETVAAEDMTNGANWFPMKLKYTEPHPNFEDMLFFEELRLMKPAE